MSFEIVGHVHRCRAEVEEHIRSVYARRYQARLTGFPPLLVAEVDRTFGVVCAAGVRFASTGFFSEMYLDQPVEELLSARSGVPVARASVLEVTTLAAGRPGSALALVQRITELGRCYGCEWGFFNATRRLRHLLHSRRLPIVYLAPGDPARVPDPQNWGSYLAADSWVIALRDGPEQPLEFIAPPPAAVAPLRRVGMVHG